MTIDKLNVLCAALLMTPMVFGAGCMQGASTVADAQSPRPFSERMGCRPWEPGLSREVTVRAVEDERGAVVAQQCTRGKERVALRRQG